MTLQTEHNDHIINYDERNDQWECKPLQLTAKTLTSLKTKINDFDAKERKLGNGVVLLYLNGYRNEEVVEVRATMLDKDDLEKYPCVWISRLQDKTRNKVGLHTLLLNTPETLAVLQEAKVIKAEAAKMVKKAEKMVADLKRISVDEIKAMSLEVKPE